MKTKCEVPAAFLISDIAIVCEKQMKSSTKTENPLSNVRVSKLGTFNRNRPLPYAVCYYPGSKSMGKLDRDLTNEDIEFCMTDAFVMENEDCFTQTVEQCKKAGGELKWIKVKSTQMIGDYELKLVVHSGSGSESWKILKNFPV